MVARRQLLAAGLTGKQIRHRLETGRLHALHRGVYAVGHTLVTPTGWRMAAVLAGGENAVLSHRSAAAHWGIRQWTAPLDDVTVPRGLHRRPRLVWHRAIMPRDEVTLLDGVPTTIVPRTLLDLAATLPRRDVERALHEAEVRRLHDKLSLHDLVGRYPNRQGVRTIKAILTARHRAIAYTRNDFEERFLAFLERFDLPLPRFNERLYIARRWIEPDCIWHEQRVIAELDGRATHDTTSGYESDRLRDRKLRVARWIPVRITWRQLTEEPEDLAADLRELLAL